MTELHQILAVEKGVKARTNRAFTDIYHLLQKSDKLSGIARTYQPKDDDGDKLPPESTRLQLRAETAITTATAALTELFNITLTKDVANQEAKAAIEVDGTFITPDLPVSYLLFLEKQLTDLATFISKLPVLDPSEEWTYNADVDAYTVSSQTTRSKKVPRNHVKAEATDKHQAQVEVYFEDIVVGYWTTTKFSGALPQARVTKLRERVAKLSDAVKVARENANKTAVTQQDVGAALLNFLFED